MFRIAFSLSWSFLLCFPFWLSAQRYIPLDSLGAEGRALVVAAAGVDTAGTVHLAGMFDGRLRLAGRQVEVPTGEHGLFVAAWDTAGRLVMLKDIATCRGGCDVQGGAAGRDGSWTLFLAFRERVAAAGTTFTSRGRPSLLMLTCNAKGEGVNAILITPDLRGRITAVYAGPGGSLHAAGVFLKMRWQGRTLRARGGDDAFFLRLRPGQPPDLSLLRTTGTVHVPRLAAREDTLCFAGTFTGTLDGGDTLLLGGGMTALFTGCRNPQGHLRLRTLAVAPSLTLHDLAAGGAALLAGGTFAGTLRSGDTAVTARRGGEAFLLVYDTLGIHLHTFDGSLCEAVERVTVDPRGRIFFLLLSGRRVVTAAGDTLAAPGRSAALFLAEWEGGRLRWARRLGGEAALTPAFLVAPLPPRLAAGGLLHHPGRRGEPYDRDGLFLQSWLDPCSRLQYELPEEIHYLCEGASDTLDAGEGFVRYLWSPGAVEGRWLAVHDTGLYRIRVTDAYGCVAEDSLRVAADSIRIRYEVEDEVLPGGGNGAIRLAVTSGLPPWEIRWNTGDRGAELTALSAGTYEVTVTDSAGCQLQASITVERKETTGVYDLSVYPNPFAEVTRILYSLPAGTEVVISLWDASGKELFVIREEAGEKGMHSFLWHRQQLDEGVYYLRMTSRFGVVTKKIVITGR